METTSMPPARRRVARLGIIGGLTLVVGLGLSMTLAAARPASATCTKTWTGASSSNWTTNGNWSPSGAPGATDFVCISTGTNSPTIGNTTTVSIAGLELDGMTLTVTGSLTMTDTTGTKSSGMTGGVLAGTGAVTIATGHVFT